MVVDTEGYPYFLQEFGKQAWNVAAGSSIRLDDMAAAVDLATHDLDAGFFRERSTRPRTPNASTCAPWPRSEVRVRTGLGTSRTDWASGQHRPGRSGPVRESLIKRGLCYAPRHGELAFTVPTFDSFIRRAF